MITADQLIKCGVTPVNANNIIKQLNEDLASYEINTPLREWHFLAQVFHESGNLNITKENLNYSAERLLVVFPRIFKTLDDAKAYHLDPERIANRIYANRMGNGNEASGDGWKYKGRGYIQITGKANYAAFKTDTGCDVITNPSILETPLFALKSALWYWNKHNLNVLADKNDIEGITRAINGGRLAIEDRKKILQKVAGII